MDCRTDAESLVTHLQTTRKPRELKLFANMALIKQDIAEERVRSVKHVTDEENLTDVLTKRGASKKKKEALRYAICNGLVIRLK